MAQPAGFSAQEKSTNMGIPVFWASANLHPPWHFKIWLEHFPIAVTFKENVNSEIMLEELEEILEEPPQDQKRQGSNCKSSQRSQRQISERQSDTRIRRENNTRTKDLWQQFLQRCTKKSRIRTIPLPGNGREKEVHNAFGPPRIKGIPTKHNAAPRELSRFDVLHYKQCEAWNEIFF